jgi:hypothetical protein
LKWFKKSTRKAELERFGAALENVCCIGDQL